MHSLQQAVRMLLPRWQRCRRSCRTPARRRCHDRSHMHFALLQAFITQTLVDCEHYHACTKAKGIPLRVLSPAQTPCHRHSADMCRLGRLHHRTATLVPQAAYYG